MDTAPVPETDSTPDAHEKQAIEELSALYFGYIASQAVHTAVRIGLPDAIGSGKWAAEELASATGTHDPTLRRLLRVLTRIGIVTETSEGEFALTPMGAPLRAHVPHSLNAMVDLFSRAPLWRAWEELVGSVRTGQCAFERAAGERFYEYCERDDSISAVLRTELTQESAAVGRALSGQYDFKRFRTVVDVGGGSGALLSAVLTEHPDVHGILVDNAVGSDPNEAIPRAAGVARRCESVVGDFFEHVPSGGDAYLLKSVVQDWDDAHAEALLRTCRHAMAPHARLLVIEHVRDERTSTTSELPLRDLMLLATTGGRVRTEIEFANLLGQAGLTLTANLPLTDTYRILEAFPA